MTGILSLLAATGDESVFVVACDMPFIKEELIRYIIDCYDRHAAGAQGQADAVIPVFREGLSLSSGYIRGVLLRSGGGGAKGEKGHSGDPR